MCFSQIGIVFGARVRNDFMKVRSCFLGATFTLFSGVILEASREFVLSSSGEFVGPKFREFVGTFRA